VIPEIDIWRIANLMLKRYGEEAEVESAMRFGGGHGCDRAARERDSSRPTALTGAMTLY
jgi:hypothetical protein